MGGNGHGWRNRIVGFDLVPARELIANPANWRKHPKAQRAALAASLKGVGWVDAVKVNTRSGHIVDGHERVQQALAKGDDTLVPVLRLDLDDAEERLALATLDPIAAMAETDADMLDALLAELSASELVADDGALDMLLREVAGQTGVAFGEDSAADAPEPQIDRAAELRALWQTERGQVWEIPSASVPGRSHRLMCGDSTSADDVARLMAGERADVCLTDPPYGLDEKKSSGKNDYLTHQDSRENLERLAENWLPIARGISPVVVFSPGVTNAWIYPEADWVMCWFYGGGQLRSSWGFNCWQPFLCYGKDPSLASGHGGRPDAVDMNVPANASDIDHPCPKPLKLWQWFIERLSFERGAVFFDPFAGSGTTLVACEQEARIGYGLELDPAYVAVTLQRLSDMGLAPVLVESA